MNNFYLLHDLPTTYKYVYLPLWLPTQFSTVDNNVHSIPLYLFELTQDRIRPGWEYYGFSTRSQNRTLRFIYKVTYVLKTTHWKLNEAIPFKL